MRTRHLLAVYCLLAGAARAQDLNVISLVEVKDDGASVVVAVKGSKPPNFTTFSMADPPRFVIDLSESRFQGVAENLQVEDGVIAVVKNLSYGSGTTSIARVMVAFVADVEPPDVQAVGNDLLVRVAKPAAAALASQAGQPGKQEASAQPQAAAQVAAQAEVAARAQAAAQAEEAERARREAEAAVAAEAQARAAADAEVARTQAEADAAARAAAESRTQAQAAAPGGEKLSEGAGGVAAEPVAPVVTAAEAARQAKAAAAAQARADAEAKAQAARQARADELQAKADAKARAAEEARAKRQADAEARAAAQAEKKAAAEAAAAERRAKALAAAEARAAAAAEKKATAEAARQAAADARKANAEALAAAGPSARLAEIGFKQLPGASRVFLRTSTAPRFTVTDVGDDVVRVELENTRAPRRNDTRFLDTSFFPSPVALITPSRQGSSYVVDIKLKQRVPYQQKVEGDMLALDFERPLPAAVPAAPGEVPPPEAGTAVAPDDGAAPAPVEPAAEPAAEPAPKQ